MNLNQIHNVYFIGIGGIGMSSLTPSIAIQQIEIETDRLL